MASIVVIKKFIDTAVFFVFNKKQIKRLCKHPLFPIEMIFDNCKLHPDLKSQQKAHSHYVEYFPLQQHHEINFK